MVKQVDRKPVDHVVRRPGRLLGDTDVEIPVPTDLTTVPGIPLQEDDVAFYSREYPIESQNIEKAARPRVGLDRIYRRYFQVQAGA